MEIPETWEIKGKLLLGEILKKRINMRVCVFLLSYCLQHLAGTFAFLFLTGNMTDIMHCMLL